MIKLLLWHKCIYETNAPKETSSSKIQYIKISENKAYSNHINKETTLKRINMMIPKTIPTSIKNMIIDMCLSICFVIVQQQNITFSIQSTKSNVGEICYAT